MATCYRHPDRETGLSCSECGRPICTECMTMAPVGIRCPDHATGTPRKQRIKPPRVARAPGRVLDTRVTAMFLHGFLLHIALNMFALWIIGRPVELYLGPTRFVLLYFVSGLAGSA